jgi:hypothetical protein
MKADSALWARAPLVGAANLGSAPDHHQFDEIIVATLPRVSRWLGADLPRQAERRFGLPVTTIITGY